MAHYQVIIAYDGTEFSGFQRQSNRRTIQGEIEKALNSIGWKEGSILSAGRTDSGVHAEGQVVSFMLDWDHHPTDLVKALNDNLPADISAKSAKKVQNVFHPRFDAVERIYRYQFVFQPMRNPLMERFFWRVWPMPERKIILKSSKKLIGTHDFSSFGKPPEDDITTARTIQSIKWKFENPDKGYIRISAKSFLYHMVRRIVYILVRIGQEKIDAVDLEFNLAGQKELPAGIAPACGLFLEKVNY